MLYAFHTRLNFGPSHPQLVASTFTQGDAILQRLASWCSLRSFSNGSVPEQTGSVHVEPLARTRKSKGTDEPSSRCTSEAEMDAALPCTTLPILGTSCIDNQQCFAHASVQSRIHKPKRSSPISSETPKINRLTSETEVWFEAHTGNQHTVRKGNP